MKHLLTQFGLSVGLASYATVGSPSADRRRQQLKHITFMLLFLLAGVGQVWGAGTNAIGTYEFTNGTTMPSGVENSGGVSFSSSRFCFDTKNDNIVITPSIPNNATTLYIVVKGIMNSTTATAGEIGIYGLNNSNQVVTNASGTYTQTTGDAGTVAKVDNNSQEEDEISFSATGVTKIKINCDAYSKKYIIRSVTITCDVASGGSPETTVSADPSSVADVAMEGVQNQTIDLTYENFVGDIIADATVHPNADGTGTLSPAWLSASVSDADDYATLTYSVFANEDAARTAYIKVSVHDEEDNNASVIIPVSQAKYSAPTGTFELFSGDIEEGDYVIYYSGRAMNNTVTSNRLQYVEVTPSDNKITNPNETIIWHIAASGDYWTLYNAAVEKYAGGTTTKNQGAVLAEVTDYAKWTITGSSTYDFENLGRANGSSDTGNKWLRNNGTYGFACYTSTQQGTGPLTLYKKQVAGQPKAPTFSVPGGNYESAQSVELSCETQGAKIYYTLDGSKPSSTSTEYSTAIPVSATTTIKAVAIKDEIESTVATATYTIVVWQTVADVWDDITADGPTNAHIYGYVSQINVGNYANNFYISDNGSTEGNQLYAYRMNMNSFSVAVGDKVKLAGDLTEYQGTKEFKYANSGATQGLVVALEAKGALQSVAVSGTPTKTEYASGEDFEPAGLKVLGTYANGFVGEITEGITWGNDLTDGKVTENTTVHVTATVDGVISAAYGVAIEVSNKALEFIAAGTASYTIYTGEALPEPTITATYNEGEPADVSAEAVYDSESAFDTETPGEQTITVSYTFGGVTKTTTYTVTVVDYANDIDNPYTPEQARYITINAIGATNSENDIFVQGIVSRANAVTGSNKRQRYWISIDGETTSTEFEVYNGKYFDGADFSTSNQLVAGDEVIVKGKVVYYNSTTPEFATDESQLVSLQRTPNFEVEAVTGFEVGSDDLAVADLNITQDGEGAVTLASSNNTDAVTIVDGELHAVAPGSATITANLAADGIYKAATYKFSVTVIPAQVKYAITFDSNGADGGSAPEAIANKAAGAEVTLPANTYTYTGHSFTGWKVYDENEDEVTVTAGAFTMPASPVTIKAQWAEISVWATTYTSNVELNENATNKCYDEGVTINTVDYSGLRIATGSAAGSATVTVPAHATKLHFHVAGWKAVSGSIDVKLEETTLATITLIADDGINQSNNNTAPYTLENDPIGYYYSVNIPDSESPTDIEFSAASGKRAVIFGVNQEGGVLPELQSIEIAGDLTTKSYKAGDALDLDGLTVNAIYSLGGTPQTPVDITDDAELAWSYDPLVENQTSVTITANYKGQTDDIEITGLEVASADPKIYVNNLNVNFGTVAPNASVEDKTITVTLTNVANATATLGGTNPEAFSITPASPAALTTSGDITISVASTANVGTYSATITISDDAEAATSKVVNLYLTVEDVETAVSTTSKWVAAEAADLVDGAEVLIVGVKDAVTYAMGADRGNNRGAVAGTVDGEGVLTPGEGTMAFVLVAQGDGTFALRTSNGKYLYAAGSSSNNHLKTRAAIENGDAKWTLTATSAIANGDNTNETVRFNSGNNPKIFSCYADETKQADIQLYVPQPAPEPVYETVRSGLEVGRHYTVCLDKAVSAVRGASFWKIENRDNAGTEVYLEEVDPTEFAAGTPFVIQATAAALEVVYDGKATTTAGTNGALRGTLEYLNETAFAALTGNIYLLINNAIRPRTTGNYLNANRAYIDYDALTSVSSTPQGAPGRRVRSMPMQGQVATGMDELNASEAPVKVLINGELFILRGEKMYNANGQLVK